MRLRFTPKFPVRRMDRGKLAAAIQQTNQQISQAVEQDIAALTDTWSSPVPVDIRFEGYSVLVLVSDRRFIWTDKGTKPHIIKPKVPGNQLHFQLGSIPKTTPKMLTGGTGAVGNRWWVTDQVNHPGTQPRGFSKMLVEKHSPTYHDSMQRAINEAIR